MAKPEWGMKRICPSCSTRYYDFNKEPPACPKCATKFDPEALLKSRRSRGIPVEEPKRKGKEPEIDVEAVTEGVEETIEPAEAGDVLIEDASDLGDESVEEVVEVAEDTET